VNGYARSLFNYRWSYRQGDFNFSPLYSGEEVIYIPIIKNGYPAKLQMDSYAGKTVATPSFFDHILVEMIIFGDDYQQKNPNYNVVYGY
jgi:hypothetical protein